MHEASASEPGDSVVENSTRPSAQNGQEEGSAAFEPARGRVDRLAVEDVAAPGVDEVAGGSCGEEGEARVAVA